MAAPIDVDQERDELQEEAQALVDYYWDEVQIYSNGEDFGLLGVRLKKGKVGITIEWYNTYYSGPKGAKKPYRKYIPKGKGYGYSKTRLITHKHRREWEIALIEQLEPKFTLLRRRSITLGKLSKAMHLYNKIKQETSVE